MLHTYYAKQATAFQSTKGIDLISLLDEYLMVMMTTKPRSKSQIALPLFKQYNATPLPFSLSFFATKK